MEIKLSKYQNKLTKKHQLIRLIWNISWSIFCKWLPRSVGRKWRLFFVNLFGGNISYKANIYPSVKIYAPWNLEMHDFSCLAPNVDCYNVDKIILEENTIVSQKSYLCTASHDISKSTFPLITSPITIKNGSWVGASCFIGMGVIINNGAVVGATSSVYKDVEPWTIVGGNPAKFIKKRIINE
ncbi:putative colanic acid biosynthesis acetyltransferase [Flammeovirga yaeyamensis]|uniref:Colanic acid biosynthesis acetyltransferase n=1 Tax=Flammeovirga yaeyamensis TaxID=367791 RepID=A0AAX1N058_9BACT|nr:putative colanic acid biosynthesis acetyltransferase [Flammeovirga yaeyamensis]MBB3700966.1 putative colanic acid biosynthesis acetyltransferase WcaF [Flammeovirga yaeyamensis]NMF38073.1 putative colanic acid biosynthesis acetyltransferase [Flammeovirga yaeyamensis]QWG00722.1 putative colanic acid biosynthesis acetyltransferase [Flammeovirga yaeyamensis]